MQLLSWVSRFGNCCFLDNNNYKNSSGEFESLAGAGSISILELNAGNAFSELHKFIANHPDYLFGHLCYDLKNELEDLNSRNSDQIQFSDLFFFVPEYVFRLGSRSIEIGSLRNDHSEVWDKIKTCIAGEGSETLGLPLISARMSKEEYLDSVQKIRQHILRGDCYELNFCQEFYSENLETDPVALYHSLLKISPAPFSAFYKNGDKYCICSSPERYLKKKGDALISQPIKGTSRRVSGNLVLDAESRDSLLNSEKEKAENVMIVDLVRNDLSRVCIEGSVVVEELFGIYSFPQVHQMISTIKGTLKAGASLTDAFRASFPMGSMTGAPKRKVMELIEKYEKSKRGLFSGSIGYITPLGDADFNVVIRSIMYNAAEKYLSYHAGSAITYNSDPETEYNECLLKVEAIKKVLAG